MAESGMTATERAEPVAWIEHHKGGDQGRSVGSRAGRVAGRYGGPGSSVDRAAPS